MKQPIQISIPQPCQEDWDKMTPTEQGRFCDRCQKCVVDFTGFTDRQLYNYMIAHKEQKICGRLNNTQLNRPINIPSQPHSLLYKYFIALGLTLVLTQATTQDISAKTPYIYNTVLSDRAIINEANDTDSIIVRGKVLDKHKEPLIGAFVELLNNDTRIITFITDEDGYYQGTLKINSMQSEFSIRITYTGFKTHIIIYALKDLQEFQTITMQEQKELMTVGAITSGYLVPLIDPFNPSNRTFTSDEIEKMPR